jgi:hypothetical protein
MTPPVPTAPKRRSAPKARTGCLTCKKRHVKCDESRPTCKRCQKTGLVCAGYPPVQTWLFEYSGITSTSTEKNSDKPVSQPSTAVLADRTSPKVQQTGIPPSADIYYEALFAGRDAEAELQAFQYFIERTASITAQWPTQGSWRRILPQAAWSNPVLRDCVVALAYTDQDAVKHASQAAANDAAVHIPVLKSAEMETRLRYYNRAVHGLLHQYARDSIAMLLASLAFAVFDSLNGRLGQSMIHLQAMSQLVVDVRESEQPLDAGLLRDIEEIAYMGSGMPFDTQELPAPDRVDLITSLRGFVCLSMARATLSRCIWAVSLIQHNNVWNEGITAHKSYSQLEKIVFHPLACRRIDFSDPPISTLPHCRRLLNVWVDKLAHTSPYILPVAEKRTLLLHARCLNLALQCIARNDSVGPGTALRKEHAVEEILDETLGLLADIRTLDLYTLESPTEELDEATMTALKVVSPNDKHKTSLRAVLGFIGLNTCSAKTLARVDQALSTARELEASWGNKAVLLMW